MNPINSPLFGILGFACRGLETEVIAVQWHVAGLIEDSIQAKIDQRWPFLGHRHQRHVIEGHRVTRILAATGGSKVNIISAIPLGDQIGVFVAIDNRVRPI